MVTSLTAAELAVIEAAEKATDNSTDEVAHLVCCREDLTLCGIDARGWEDCAPGESERCIRCDVIDEAAVPCGARFCRLRSWWRGWRS